MEIGRLEQPMSAAEIRAPELQVPAIPVLRPRLPAADRLLPYLRRIDVSRIYSNWGPLANELELRLSERFGLAAGGVTSASSGTSALIGAVLARAGRATPERPLAITPAFTFAATGLAIEQCGYRLHLADVEAESWMLDPDRLGKRDDLHRVGVVVPVAPFGCALAQRPWQAFSERTGIPVVIDAAASFEALAADPASRLGSIPVAISFHATKSFGVGEGGCVACADVELIRTVTQALNFGSWETRATEIPSTNGKLSEYHAAIGLAALDGWAEKSAAVAAVIHAYRAAFETAGLAGRLITAPTIASNYLLFQAKSAIESTGVQDELLSRRIGYRLWYGAGLHHHPYWREVSSDAELGVGESLASRLIGLPMAPDLPMASIDAVRDAVSAGVVVAGGGS